MDKRWEKLFALHGKSDLNIIKNILEKLKFSKKFKIINVVGTNGKGSVAKMIAKALENSGKKVGLFTSPHIVHPNERISINGVNILDRDFFNIANTFKIKQFFSILFIVAMKYFQEQQIDYAVIEAGVGGALDPTNAVDGNFGILTSVGIDHTKYLGNTHQSIFDDKVGIVNKKMNFFIPKILPKDINITSEFKIIDNRGATYQKRNIALVKKFLKISFNIELKDTQFPKGRTEIKMLHGQQCIFDVAHNKDAILATLELLKYKNIEFDDVIVAFSQTKDISGIFELFKDKKIKYYKPDETFRDFYFKKIVDIKNYKIKAKTLFIGSFKLIGALYE